MNRARRYWRIADRAAAVAVALMLPTSPRWLAEWREVVAALLVAELVTELCRVDVR